MGGTIKTDIGTRSPLKIIVNIFISFIGAGILGLPYAFKESGLLEGIFIMVLVSFFSTKAMILIIQCKYKILGTSFANISLRHSFPMEENYDLTRAKKWKEVKQLLLTTDEDQDCLQMVEFEKYQAPSLNYGDIGYHALGGLGRWLVDLTLLISQLGFCCAYLIFILENVSSYIPYVNKSQWLILLLPPLFLLTLLRHLHKLAIFSFFAQISNVFALAVVFWFDFEHVCTVKQRFHPKEFSLKGFPFFFAMAIYCYEGAGMILSLEESLSIEVRNKFSRYLLGTLSVVTLLYIAFGVSGYMSFGSETNEIITINLPKGSGMDFAMIVKLFLCISLFFTYPVMMFPVTRLLETRFLDGKDNKIFQQNLLRLLLVALTGLIVILIPNFANLMAFIGATCCTLLAFILPGLFHFFTFKSTITRWECIFDGWLILFGLAGAVIGTQDALQRMIGFHAAQQFSPVNSTSLQVSKTH